MANHKASPQPIAQRRPVIQPNTNINIRPSSSMRYQRRENSMLRQHLQQLHHSNTTVTKQKAKIKNQKSTIL
jgi:hypothetical protein